MIMHGDADAMMPAVRRRGYAIVGGAVLLRCERFLNATTSRRR